MKRYFNLILMLTLMLVSTSCLAVNSELLIQTDRHWNQQPIKPLHINQPQVTVLRIKIAVGEKLEMHKHPVLNIGYLTKGELSVYSDKGDVLVLKAGDPIVELVDTWHYGVNTGDQEAEIVVTYVGEKEDSLTIYNK